MDNYRKTGIVVGLLFIIATVTAICTIVFLGNTLETPLSYETVSENDFSVVISVIFWIILAISVAGIGFMMYPILKKYHEGIALGYISFRLLESICIIISSIMILSLLTISQEYSAGSFDVSNYQQIGTLLLSIQEWSFEIGTLFFLGLGGIFIYYPIYKLNLVPKVLSLWGLIGAICVLLYGLISLFGQIADSIIINILAAPIAIQEMVFAVWLIFKGFNKSAIKD
jgi:hypothetical protein